MADPIKMMPSHGNEGDSLQAEDYQTILDLIKAKDPRGMKLAQSLRPEEVQAFFDFQKGVNKGINPAASPDRNLATGIPVLGSMDPADVVPFGLMGKKTVQMGGQALRGFANSPEGFWQGIKGALKGILPDIGGVADTAAPEAASQGTKLRVPNGRPGSGLSPGEEAGVQGLDELFSRTGNDAPNPFGHGTYKPEVVQRKYTTGDYAADNAHMRARGQEPDIKLRGLAGEDTAGLKKMKNVDAKRTPDDVLEQVTGSSRNGYADPRSESLDYSAGETDRSVEAIQDEISRKLSAAETTRKSKLRKPK